MSDVPEDLYEKVAAMLRLMDGGVTGAGTGTDKTWVFTPEDCTCDQTGEEHEADCPFSDPAVIATVTVELGGDAAETLGEVVG